MPLDTGAPATLRVGGAMRAVVRVVVLLLVAGVVALAWSFRPATLPLGADLSVTVPAAHPPADMRLSALPTGAILSRAGLAYRGGSLAERRVFAMTPILVRHPRGDLLFDAGFGKNIDAHVPSFYVLFTRYEKGTPAAEQLRAGGYDPARLAGIVLTHAHFDHVSGLPDFPGVPVWVDRAELDFIRGRHPAAALARSFGDLPYRVYGFPNGPYLGFAESFDVFGDGSVVLVPAPGHTPGSIVAFITLPSGRRYALVGDLVWQREGIDLPAERPWLSRQLADTDPEAVRRAIVHMHRLQALVPGLVIVPAHDARVLEALPRFPDSVG
jgi:glyoxylase-like metal-dependent hydrolase (beta-lactamase superfamily II)